jgi:choline dehydrogenase-like flavoprotein
LTFDTIIIGSGVAAVAIAQRLLEKNANASILILEAGQRVKLKDYALWTDYLLYKRAPYDSCRDLAFPSKDVPGENLNLGKTNMELRGARLFCYGGSTTHWGGWSFRLKPEDFHLRANTGEGLDWPFSYEVLEPYYGQAETYLAVSGDSQDKTVPRSTDFPFRAFPFTLEDQPIAQSMKSLGIAFAKLPIARRGVSSVPSRHAPCQTTGTCKYCPFGARFAAANYLDDIRSWTDYPNLEVRLGAVVEEINMASKTTAASVTYTDQATGQKVLVGGARIVAAAGTIESAKLLMRSRSNYWPAGVGNDHDNVGRYIVTHPYFTFQAQLPANPLKLQPEMDFPTLVSRHFDSEREQRAGKWMMVNLPDTVPIDLAGKMQQGFTRGQVDAYVSGPATLQVAVMAEVFGRRDNRIENLWDRNGFGLPQTAVSYSADQWFVDTRIGQIRAEVGTIFAKMGATLTADPSQSWRADHAGSTCRMSIDPADGVVDGDLKVHGTENLYVCSNAVFPNIGAVNPTLTVTALALRLADHIRGGGA